MLHDMDENVENGAIERFLVTLALIEYEYFLFQKEQKINDEPFYQEAA